MRIVIASVIPVFHYELILHLLTLRWSFFIKIRLFYSCKKVHFDAEGTLVNFLAVIAEQDL